ncbi:hypothetical protein [Streptomyces sp. NPDC005012]|uniref:hypothetical protein n=1 Tax=Streptomyces sp. NPDC005012 TaxID=3154558 RepID=UPI0033B9E0C1
MRVRRATATVLAAFALVAGLGAGTAVAAGDDDSPNLFSGTLWTSEEGNYGTANAGHVD